ncbi:non-homologous end-joining DNA ligase [Aromatoleum diolicum]|uniref:DNA ligase (ATP) n=1 Tax=Aromatoleum diolicum TaxID=75796 RepID=A0ABX1QCJ0_9RHOO|nr:non-homologous end-joining DNA ligase [Aromatoleum diolicum]NMG74909.1 ATP-dependent DNA ligase [Aromatoleum diolicum]
MPRGVEVAPSRKVRRVARPSAAKALSELGQLDEYAAKRTFAATPEPAPSAAPAAGGPLLFVIQQHSARRLHFDFRLECDGVLKSWAVPKGPSLDPSEKRLAVQTEDHPYDYASFEGVIPPGQYGAGEVIVWDCGVYSPDEEQAYSFADRDEAQQRVRDGLAKGKLSFQLRGEKVKGSFALVRTSDSKNWLLIKHKDRFTGPAAGLGDITERNRSVLSGLAVEEIKVLPAHRVPAATLAPHGPPSAMPAKLSPMLAEIGEAPFADAGWLWEPKLDGYRVLAFVAGDEVKLLSRRGLDLTATFPGLCAELRAQAADMILDGELVAFDASGRPSFNALQNRFQLKNERDIAAADRTTPAVFCCFDLLHFGGVDLRLTPYRDRRRYLTQCLLPSHLLQLVHAAEDGKALYRAALASGFEGVVGKRRDSRYEGGRRSGAWLKVKATQSGEFVVGGYTKGKGSRAPLGALLIGFWDGAGLRYASHVGSGFDAETLAQMRARLDGLRTDACPFVEKPELHGPTTWVAPEVVVEVKFQQWTEDDSLRAPVLLRVRDDIDPKAVRRPMHDQLPHAAGPPRANKELGEIGDVLRQLENNKVAFPLAVGPHRIRLTHLDRVYWPADPALKQPAVTKRDLLRYFAQVSPYLLPHLADRPLTLIRMPDGIFGQRFFQKHWEQERPEFVDTMSVFSEHKDESHQALLCNNLATLLWLAQSGTLELHVWHSRARPGPDAATQGADYDSSLAALEASVLNFPDYVVFDLDPYIYSGNEAPGAEPELNTVAFEKGKEVAFHLRELLQSMALDAIVKTSGKTGLHIFVPIRRTIDFDAARKVCELVGRHLLRHHPKDITMEWSVRERIGKIFLDHNMNVRGKTLNVAYSPRGVPGAPVSMPLTWDELASAHPLDFRITNVAQRLSQTGDRWHDALARKLSLERALSGART